MRYFNSLFRRLKLDRYASSSTIKNISILMTGTFVSAIIPLITAPVMTRIYTTSDYGILGLFMSISSLLGVLAYGHYAQAVIIAKQDDEAKQAVWFCIMLCLLFSIATLVVILALQFFFNTIQNSIVGKWYYFVPLSLFLNGITSTLLLWANRNQQYKQLSVNRVVQAILTVIVQISCGLILRNETGLMLGLITGQLISAFLLLKQLKSGNQLSVGVPDFSTFKGISLKYKSLLFFSTPTEFINNLITQTPVFLLQKFGGISYVGSYNFTQRLLGIPQLFLSSSLNEVFKQKASSVYNAQGNCKILFLKTTKSLVILAFIPFSLLALFAPQIFSFVFGSHWRDAGVFAQYLSILFFFRFVVSPLSYMYYIAGRLREDLMLHLLFLLSTTAAFFVGNLIFENKMYLMLLYSLLYSSVYLIYFFRSYRFSKGN